MYPQPRPPPSVDDAINAIRSYMRHKGMSIYRVAKLTSLSLTSIRYLHEPTWNPTAVTLRVLYSMIPPDFDPDTAPPAPGYDLMLEWKREVKQQPKPNDGGFP